MLVKHGTPTPMKKIEVEKIPGWVKATEEKPKAAEVKEQDKPKKEDK